MRGSPCLCHLRDRITRLGHDQGAPRKGAGTQLGEGRDKSHTYFYGRSFPPSFGTYTSSAGSLDLLPRLMSLGSWIESSFEHPHDPVSCCLTHFYTTFRSHSQFKGATFIRSGPFPKFQTFNSPLPSTASTPGTSYLFNIPCFTTDIFPNLTCFILWHCRTSGDKWLV